MLRSHFETNEKWRYFIGFIFPIRKKNPREPFRTRDWTTTIHEVPKGKVVLEEF